MSFLTVLISEAHAMAPAPGGQQGGVEGLVTGLLPLVLIFVVFYFLLIRPQQKKAKEHRQMLALQALVRPQVRRLLDGKVIRSAKGALTPEGEDLPVYRSGRNDIPF